MGGFSFISAGFLATGLAVAVPVLIHLLFRQKARTIPIGSVRFLQQVVREHRRRRRVRQWLLLALRTLAVLLLALLFARPFLNQLQRRGLDHEVVILVDRSASMQSRSGAGPTALQRAIDEARRETRRIDENVAIHWAWFDAGGVEELPFDKFFGAAPTSWLGTDYGLALGWAQDILDAGGRAERRIVLITDLQRDGLDRSTIVPLDPQIVLEVRDIGEAVVSDLAVMQADVPRTEIRPGEPIKIRVVVRNGGALPVRQVSVEAQLTGPQGLVRAAKSIDVPGGGNAVVEIPFEIRESGIYRGTVAVDSVDALEWDNRRFVAFEARPPDRVLLVDGQEGRSVFANETYFLETALRLRSGDSAERVGAFEVERIVWDAGEGFPNLAGFRAIVLANVRRLTDIDLERLVPYVQQGGSLVFFAGDQTTSAMLDALREAGLLGGKPRSESIAGPFRTSQWDPTHPALKLFSDPQRGDLRRLDFSRLWPLEPDDSGKPILSAGSHAVVVERVVDRGRVLYLGCTADRDWSDWPRSRLYVPLVRQFLAYATGALAERSKVHLETMTRSEQVVGIVDREGDVYVANVDPREAVLDRTTIEEFAQAAGTQAEDTASMYETQQAAIAAAPRAERPEEAWKFVMWSLFAVLTAEVLLASRIHA